MTGPRQAAHYRQIGREAAKAFDHSNGAGAFDAIRAELGGTI